MVIEMIHYKHSEIIIDMKHEMFVLINLGNTHIQTMTEEIANAA
jgi:hypothetical protein